MNKTTGNSFGDEFRNASLGAGHSVTDTSSLVDDRTRVSDTSVGMSRVEQGYKNMDHILADARIPKGKYFHIYYNL